MNDETLARGGPAAPAGASVIAAGDLPPRLAEIGDDLERATRRDLRTAWQSKRRRRRRAIGAAAALAVLIPGAALAHGLLTTEAVSRSMPAGTKFLEGTTPKCTTVTPDVEYRCTIDHPVNTEIANLTGTVEPTVAADRRVNGGCRSLNAKGTEWECYIGRAAVQQRITGAGFLGQRVQGPGQG
jgi:hypothetical protein